MNNQRRKQRHKQIIKELSASKGITGLLPGNLPDQWLAYFTKVYDMVFEEDLDPPDSLPSLAVFALQRHKTGKDHFTEAEITDCMKMYHIELSLEIQSRFYGLKYNPATLEDIFEDDRLIKATY